MEILRVRARGASQGVLELGSDIKEIWVGDRMLRRVLLGAS